MGLDALEKGVPESSKSNDPEKSAPEKIDDSSSKKKKKKKKKSGESNTPASLLKNMTAAATRGILDAKDQGHRYGNFHNYYSFNPTQERMKLLEKSGGILDVVANHWNKTSTLILPSKSGGTRDEGIPPTKKPKLEGESSESTPASNMHQEARFCYLDVGCNEGDLTMEVAKALAARLSGNRDRGRTESGDNAARSNSTFDNNNNENKVDGMTVSATGVDIDKELIRRANRKYKPNEAATASSPIPVLPSFQVSNVLSGIFLDNQSDTNVGNDSEKQEQQFYFTSLFSTTMWLHIHGGDEGLRRALGDICRCTKSFVLVEPQPSKW